jgi:hypothetical protein
MLSERDIEQAHPEALDFVFGNLPAARHSDFNRHLTGCRYCQGVIDEYGDIGAVIKNLPPHVEPPPDLEARTVAAMVAALAEQRAEAARRPDAEDREATRVYPIPQQPSTAPETRFRLQAAGQPAPAGTPARPVVTHLSAWRRHRVRLAAVISAAAAIIVAVVISLSMGGGGSIPAQVTAVIPLHATTAARVHGYGAATGRAIARQDSSGSWNISLTVAHLKSFGDHQWYQCWYVSRNHQQVASAGTFQVLGSGSRTFSMTSAVDPRDFPTMEITLGPPSKNGALGGTVVLTGHALVSA